MYTLYLKRLFHQSPNQLYANVICLELISSFYDLGGDKR